MTTPYEPQSPGLYVTRDLLWLLVRSKGQWSRCALHGTANAKSPWADGTYGTADWDMAAKTLGEDNLPPIPLGQWFYFELPQGVPDRGPLGVEALEGIIDPDCTGSLSSVGYVRSLRDACHQA